jgi:hypothetical protein
LPFCLPGNRPEGIEALKKAVAGMAKDSDLVLYCGCCPMITCPTSGPITSPRGPGSSSLTGKVSGSDRESTQLLIRRIGAGDWNRAGG